MQTLFYYHKRTVQPFRNMMELSDSEIIGFMCAKLPEDAIFHRNPAEYLKRRRETESWLYEAFCGLGGKPLVRNPLYLTVGRSSFIESQDIYTERVHFPLSDFSKSASALPIQTAMFHAGSLNRVAPISIPSFTEKSSRCATCPGFNPTRELPVTRGRTKTKNSTSSSRLKSGTRAGWWRRPTREQAMTARSINRGRHRRADPQAGYSTSP